MPQEQDGTTWREGFRQRWHEIRAFVMEVNDRLAREQHMQKEQPTAEGVVMDMDKERKGLKQRVPTYVKNLYKKKGQKAGAEEAADVAG